MSDDGPFVKVILCRNCGQIHPTHVHITEHNPGEGANLGIVGKCPCGENLWSYNDLTPFDEPQLHVDKD